MRRAYPLIMLTTSFFACGEDSDASSPSVDASEPSIIGDAGGTALDATLQDASQGDASSDAGRDAEVTLLGFLKADHCSPGSYDFDGLNACNDSTQAIQAALSSGIAMGMLADDMGVDWQKLMAPMNVGEPFAISAEVTKFNGSGTYQIELWGVMSQCGLENQPAELLGSTPMNQGKAVYCINSQPQKPYTHLMLVYRHTSGQHSGYATHGAQYCANGSCPTR